MQTLATGDLQRITSDYRTRLLALQDQGTAGVAAEWKRLDKTIAAEYAKVRAKVEKALAEGKVAGVGTEAAATFSQAWLMQRDALQQLSLQAAAEARRAAERVEGKVVQARTLAARLGARLASEQASALVASFAGLPVEAVEAFVGSLSAGPLRDLFRTLGPQMGVELRGAIERGIALGRNPREVGRMVP